MKDNGARMSAGGNWAHRAGRKLAAARKFLFGRRRGRTDPEKGVTFIEIVIMSLIMTIALVAITKAIQVASQGALAAKERARALSLARDKLEEVKNMGYEQMKVKLSNYYYPDNPDTDNPLHQVKTAAPYPITKPTPDEDPWTPENILVGKITYWRHVVVKFVEEDATTKQLIQKPEPNPPTVVGGTNAGSNLAYIEVDVTWFSRRINRMEQVRVSTLLANQAVTEFALGQISGTVLDDDCGAAAPAGCTPDHVDEPPEESGLPPPPVTPGPDDKPITWASLVIIARNVVSGDTFTTVTDSQGHYRITSLPEGDYLVRLAGAPLYVDSYYTGESSGTYSTNPAIEATPVTIQAEAPTQRDINIWTQQVYKGELRGWFKTDAVAPATHRVRISCNDGVSQAVELPVDAATCATGCYFAISNVAFPAEGTANYEVRIRDLDTGQSTTAYICFDVDEYNPFAKTVYLGMTPVLPTPYCGACSLFPDCTRTATPFDVGSPLPLTQTSTASIVRVKMMETDDTGAIIDLANPAMGCIRLDYTPLSGMGSPMSVTFFIDEDDGGATKFEVPGGEAQKIQFVAYMGDREKTTTGYTIDRYFLPFTLEAPKYDLEPGSGFSAVPEEEDRHLFVVTRVSAVCGTVWSIAGTKGFAGAQVNIRNDSTKWSTVVTADGSGRFYAGEVPVDDMLYTVAPVVGADYISNPISEPDVEIVTNGIVYSTDKFGGPLEFTLNAINGIIKGGVTVGAGGPILETGAVIIASTYNTGTSQFVSSLSDTVLAAEYTYSAITRTDGSYEMRTATGAGFDYWIYCSAVVDGVEKYYKSSAAVTPSATAEVIHNISLP